MLECVRYVYVGAERLPLCVGRTPRRRACPDARDFRRALDARGEGDTSIRALEPPAHAAAATYRPLAFELEYAKL